MARGARTKGWIKNNKTSTKKSFQYNPENLSYSRAATYVEISAPGMSYPNTQYVRGNIRSFTVELLLDDYPSSTGLIEGWRTFLETFLPPEKNGKYEKPPDMTFCYGYFIRKCVVEQMEINDDMFDESGQPIRTRFNLTLRQVGV